jgi:aspartate/methionine/tyrosine aminotransferase
MVAMLRSIDGVTCQDPQGAFYAFPNLTGLLGRPLRGRVADTTLDLAAILLDEVNVAIVPGEAFGAPGYARLSFALSDENLAEGLGRVADLVSSS